SYCGSREHVTRRAGAVWKSLPQNFMEFCRTASVPCLDLTDRLQQAVREGVDVYAPNDTHWSSEGNAVVAAELEHLLRTHRLTLASHTHVARNNRDDRGSGRVRDRDRQHRICGLATLACLRLYFYARLPLGAEQLPHARRANQRGDAASFC